MPKYLLILMAASAALFAQGQSVNQVGGPPPNNFVNYYDVASTPQYVCYAQAVQPTTQFTRGSTTLTNIVVTTNVGVITFSSTSYLWVGALVAVSGSTTAALNGTYKITAVSGSTASIATSGVGDATYNNAAMVVSTTAPLLNAAVWAIQVTQYTGTAPLTQYWAGTPTPTPAMGLACSNRANY